MITVKIKFAPLQVICLVMLTTAVAGLGWSVGTKTTWQHSLLMLDDMEWWLGRSHKYPTPYNRVIPSLLSYYQIFKKFINANKETSLMIEFLVKNVTSIIVQKHKSKSRSRLFLDYSPLSAPLGCSQQSAHQRAYCTVGGFG